MSYDVNPYQSAGYDIAAHAQPNERVDFIRKTYLHLGGAMAVFVALVDRDNRGRIVFEVPPPNSPP